MGIVRALTAHFESGDATCYVETESEKQTLDFDVHRPSCQETLEALIPLQDSKCTLCLNGAVHPKQGPLIACDVRKALSPVVVKSFCHMNLFGVLAPVALA